MNWLIILLISILNIQSVKDLIKVHKAILLENDFWCASNQFISDKGYLNKVIIDVERKSGYLTGFEYYSETCYSLKSTNFGYIVPENWTKDEYNFLDSLEFDKFLLRFRFFFTGGSSKEKIQEYFLTFKMAEKKSENSAKLRRDGIDIRMEHINERFELFLTTMLLKFNEYIKILEEKKEESETEESKTENDADFDLYYFENYLECFASLKEFTKELCYLNLLKDNFLDSFTAMFSKIFIDKTTTLKVSQFRRRLRKKFFGNLIKLYGNRNDNTWRPLFDRCCFYFENVIRSNKIFLLIGGKYNIDYYIEQLSNLIFESVKERRRNYVNSSFERKDFILSRIADLLKFDLQKLQLRAMKDLVAEFIPKHFSNLVEKEIKTLDDYKTLEKIVCDYYNMFVYIVSLYYELNGEKSRVSYSYFSPIYIDNYNLKIIEGIKIEFKLGKIRGFDYEGKKVILDNGTDYFIDKNILYCPSDVLRIKNIQEIEVISSNNDKKRFKVNEYLSI